METLVHDLRYAVRSLRRSPAFAAVGVLTLAVGIGASTAIFTAIQGVLLRPLPYSDPDRVVFIQEKRAVTGQPSSVSPLNYLVRIEPAVLMPRLYELAVIPPAVYAELTSLETHFYRR